MSDKSPDNLPDSSFNKASDSSSHKAMETRLVHGEEHSQSWDFSNQLVPPMTSNTTYRLRSVERGAKGFAEYGSELAKNDKKIWIYDRLDEPNNLMLEEQLSFMEKTEGSVTFSSGMGAISAVVLSSLKAGDLIYSDSAIYGCTFSLFKNHLPRFNINTEWKDFSNLDFLDQVPKNLKLIYFESVANPTLKVIDILKVTQLVKKINETRDEDNKIRVAVDNTFATPLACNPIELGADFTIHSLTKNISGFGTELGGSVSTSKEWITPLKMIRKDFGAVLNSKSSWSILNHGLPTMHLRFNKQEESAKKIASYLSKHEKIDKVLYPGLDPTSETFNTLSANSTKSFHPGFMISFTLKDEDNEVTKSFINTVAKESYTITLAVSLGLTKTLIEVPKLMTHSSYDEASSQESNIGDTLIRLSIGVENADDIINDLDEALQKI
jgi:methionine-gamma-lyase